MSIINRMLQDLDRRQGTADPDATLAMARVRTVPAARRDREWFWRIIAALMVVALAWVGWIAWQLQPRDPIVTEQAFRAAENAQRRPTSVADAKAAEPKPAPEAQKPAAPQASETLKLAPGIETPIREPAPKPAAKEGPKPATKEVSKAASREAAAPALAPPAKLESDKPLAAPGQKAVDAAPGKSPAALAQGAPKVEKRDRVRTPEERAEMEFRRGAALLNQGRAGEAEESFAGAIAGHPAHEAARQALVALHLEQRRIDEARRLLQEGLAVNPANTRFAGVLARIFVERKDYGAALDVIGSTRAAGEGDATLQALRGTVLERMGRHGEASEAFRISLRIAPQSTSSWVGLGIALDAQGKRAEAAEAFRRAVALGPADSPLAQFASERLKALE